MSKIRRIRDRNPGRHRQALEETLSGVAGVSPALAELARDLAEQCDQAQPNPTTTLMAGYLSALKDIARHGREDAGNKGGKLAELRAVTMAKLSPIPDNTPPGRDA